MFTTKHWCIHLKLSGIQAEIHMLVSFAAVLQMIESFDLVQGEQQTPGEQVYPQHAGWIYT